MPQIKLTDFSSGWTPSDDQFNGRKNGLLKMDGATLDENGALVMPGGTKKIAFQYPDRAHTLFSKFVCGERRRYVALEDGSVYRNEVEIVAAGSGSTERAAFGLFGDFVLITSGATKIKDICGSDIGNLGLNPPDDSVDVTPIVTILDTTPVGTLTNFIEDTFAFGGTFTTTATDFSITTPAAAIAALNLEMIYNANASDFPRNLAGIDSDIFEFQMMIDDLDKVSYIKIRFGNTAMNTTHDVILGGDDLRAVMVSGAYRTFRIRRDEFGEVGNESSNWTNIERVDFLIAGTASSTVTATFKDFILYDSTGGALDGTYTWLQVNVFRQGAFVSKSLAGPPSDSFTIRQGYAVITPQDPTIIEPSANEVWIYRRGGNLPDYYRVGIITLDAFGTFDDILSDTDVLAINERLNDSSLTIADGITDDILEIVGPVHGRMLYFTAEEVNFSDIGNPDTFNPNRTLSTVRSDAEKFLWARLVSENVVLIGTSQDIYTLTGTWITYPDGVIDVELRPLGLDKPPISRDVAVYKSNVAYFSARGWTIMGLSNDYVTLINPSTHLLYNGESRYDYGGVPVAIEPSYRYSIVIAKDKMFCVAPVITDYTSEATREDRNTWSLRLEVYDMLQKYWRPFNYCPWLLDVEDDGTVLGFYDTDNRLAIIDYAHSKLLNFVE